MRAGLLLILAMGCGGSTKPAPTPVTPPPPVADGSGSAAPPAVAAAPTPAAICKRITELKAQKCGSFTDLEIDEVQCVGELAKAGNDPALAAFTGCVVQPSCEEVKNCLTAASQQAPEEIQELRACDDRSKSYQAVGLPAAEWNKRNGAGVTKYAAAKSTKDLPIEMCGIREENSWLVSLTCNDGSHPIMDAETARVGNVGTGGRCGAIIDKYAVKCPEKTYDIFIDAYVCSAK
ncbi:hypothetical protein BH11MYX3_BH11MYX3_12720 [soil metagenome]